MKCNKCGQKILDPVMHEFCEYKRIAKHYSDPANAKEALVPVIIDHYVAPKVQRPLNHQVIKKTPSDSYAAS